MPTSDPGLDIATAMRMLVLTRNGRAALSAYLDTLPAQTRATRPAIPEYFDVVTEADFAANPIVCLQHAVRNARPVHILSPNGSICALLQRLRGV